MIRVLMCGNHPSNKGGMTSVINQIRDHDWGADEIELKFIPTYIPGNPVKKVLFFVVAYIKIAVRLMINKPDVVHMHMSYKGSFSRKYLIHKLCRKKHVPDIIHLHGSEFEQWYNSVNEKKKKKIRVLLREASEFVVLGEKWKRIVKNIEPSSNVTVVGNGVAMPNEIVTWNEEHCNVLFLGVLIKRKGVADLLQAIQGLSNQNRIGRLHFIIAGIGEEESELKQLSEKYGISNYIDFIGWVSGEKKRDYLTNSQIMILPSYNEGLPISILEAMSFGIPVISTDVGDIPSVIRHCENGLLFSPGDIEAMQECILYLTDMEKYSRLSKNARKTIEENYSLNLFITNVKDLYMSVQH